MSDPRFFRQYLDILNEAPPAPTPAAPVSQDENPSKWQQAKTAIGQQVDTYKEIGAGVDAAAKQGAISQQDAQDVKAQTARAMIGGGIEAGKAALTGRDPSAAYMGSIIKSQGNAMANSGLDSAMKQLGPEISQYRGPNAKDITKDPSYLKASPELQAQAVQAQQKIRDVSDDEWAHLTSGNAMKQAGATTAAAGQEMIDQKDWGKGAASGYSPETNKLFGLDPTRQATDAELDAAATGTNEELERMKKFIRR